ncbi:hypothetical protein EGI20_08700 [Aquitalea sp. S1-19]|nr:hypothetical protein [Aquitalea sp. S1-19]
MRLRLLFYLIGVSPFVLTACWLFWPHWQEIAVGSLFLGCTFTLGVVVVDALWRLLGWKR